MRQQHRCSDLDLKFGCQVEVYTWLENVKRKSNQSLVKLWYGWVMLRCEEEINFPTFSHNGDLFFYKT